MKENEKLEMILVEDDEVLELEEIYDDTFPAVENISNNSDILKNEEKFLQLLYFLNKKEDIVNLLKMRLLVGEYIPLKEILWRSGKEKREFTEKFKYRKFGDGDNEKGSDDNKIQEFYISNVFKEFYQGSSNERVNCLYKKDWRGILWYEFYGDYINWSNDNGYKIRLRIASGELYLKMRCRRFSEYDFGYYTFAIDVSETERFIQYITNIIYEKNLKNKKSRDFFYIPGFKKYK